ncbi:two-component regulator propeller domain-containing protein [Autumnicola musiva]|uniref:histidine kinase n=1 Tax=Autumnicola musiva TaxID=3075589 RepID=A0ABU3D977_9FLAO|nr:two-component regulator propeller domain-containing protein [Zunongwangia sp. F117]MDT0677899.1 two-component regulator propeller domain-containing protein [Zunongwangia sp. F117]
MTILSCRFSTIFLIKLVLVILPLFAFTSLKGQDIKFKKITAKDGLSHSTVYDIAQDENGLMWFGTREGLNSFNGKEIQSFYHQEKDKTSLINNQINTIEALSDGLYIGTFEGLDRFLPETHSFEHILNNSVGSVNSIIETNIHDIYAGTTKGLFKITPEGKKYHYLKDKTIVDIESFKSNVYIIALNQSLLLINNFGEIIKKYKPPVDSNPPSNPDSNIYTINCLFKDRWDNIWLGTSIGLFLFDPQEDTFQHIPIGNTNRIEAEVIRSIDQDKSGRLWLGTESGIFIYNSKEEKVVHYSQSFSSQPETLSDKSIYSIFISDEEITWIGTYFGGVNYTSPESLGIQQVLPSDYKNSISGKAISQIIKTKKGEIWIGTEDGGISIYNPSTEKFSFLKTSDGLSSNNIHALEEDDSGYIWIGTFLGGLNRFDKKSGEVTIMKSDKKSPHSISNNFVYALCKDHSGRLWVGTQFGLNIYDYQTGQFSLFKPEVLGDKFIYDILEDSNHNLWFCTRNSGIFKLEAESNQLFHCKINSFPNDGKNAQIVNAYEDLSGNIWFGSLNEGVIIGNKNKSSLKPFSENKDLPNTNVYSILEDEYGKFWISTNKGISIFDPNNNNLKHLGIEDGLTTNQFNFKSAFKDDNGVLYFGSIYGLNIIDPAKLDSFPEAPKIQFTGFQLFNKEIPITEKGILRQHINSQNDLVLNHKQDVISFKYGAINYGSEGAVKYAYKLDGFDEIWNTVGTKTTATYTNLAPGEYRFRVQTLPLNNENERSIQLTVLPPFWKTNTAYIIYLIFIIFLIYAYWRFVRFIHKQKLAVQMERLEKEKISELNKHKLNFFTFISHEFKTPLTLIIASAEKFFREKTNNSKPPEELISIKKSADKLNQLIQQLLEFRKIETDHAQLELRKGDIILFLKDTFEAFHPLFERKQIKYSFKTDFTEYSCYFDPSKVEMIATNLISNSLKNTSEGGSVELKINISNSLDEQKRSSIMMSFSDTGSGMSKEVIAKVFEPFYKSTNEDNTGGSGLGLALVKSLTKFLNGNLSVKSELLKGTEINVEFPLILKSKSTEKLEEIQGNKSLNVSKDLIISNFEVTQFTDIEKKSNLKILIAEDNVELMKFLHKHFSGKFQVITAKDGEQALQKIENSYPDVIISDMKMPKISGLQLCKKIKSTNETKHIPFLLLTAKNDENLKLDALGSGANAYLAKPFNLKELDLLVTNLLETSKNLEKRFSDINSKEQEAIPANNQDREFLRKISSLVEKFHSDPKFGVEILANEAGMSRSLLHLKMKKITGLSALEYIKRKRMKKATRLIKEGKNISEVAYQVGYSDPNYFSRAFKKEFNLTPTQFADQS